MPGGFRDFLEDLFAPLGGVAFRRMFGGYGIYRDGVMFALVTADVLYLKADAETVPVFEREGCGPFVYEARGRPVTMSYWRLPERLHDEPEEFRDWALAACAAAARAGEARGPTRARKRRRSAPAGA